MNYDRTGIPTSYGAHYRPVQAGRVINVSILIALTRESTIIARLKVHSSIVDAIMPRASFYTLVTRESRNERYSIRRMTAFLMVPLSLSLSNRYDECLRRMQRACARLRAPLRRSTGPASSISRRDAKVQQNSLAAIPGNSIPGNDFTPRVTRLYAIPFSLSVACQPSRNSITICNG